MHIRWVLIRGKCADENCGFSGPVDASIDPEDRLNGMDAVWKCPFCRHENTSKEGTWYSV